MFLSFYSIIWLAEHISVCREVQVTKEALCRCDQGWSVSSCQAEDKRGEVTFPQTPDHSGREELEGNPASSLSWRACNQRYQLTSLCVSSLCPAGAAVISCHGPPENHFHLVGKNETLLACSRTCRVFSLKGSWGTIKNMRVLWPWEKNDEPA